MTAAEDKPREIYRHRTTRQWRAEVIERGFTEIVFRFLNADNTPRGGARKMPRIAFETAWRKET